MDAALEIDRGRCCTWKGLAAMSSRVAALICRLCTLSVSRWIWRDGVRCGAVFCVLQSDAACDPLWMLLEGGKPGDVIGREEERSSMEGPQEAAEEDWQADGMCRRQGFKDRKSVV